MTKPLSWSLVVAVSLGACSSTTTPWTAVSAAEAQLREAAERAAWTPEFLTSPELFERLSRKRKEQFAGTPFLFATLKLAGSARFYVIADPTENIEPPLRHWVVMVRRDESNQVVARVVTPEIYFKGIFEVLGGSDPQPEEFAEACMMFVKLFGCDHPQPSRTNVLFSPRDIPTTPEEPLPQDVARRIAAPEIRQEFKGGSPWWIRFECSLQGWESYSGHLGMSHFEIDYCEDVEKSKVKVTCRTLAERVGRAVGLK